MAWLDDLVIDPDTAQFNQPLQGRPGSVSLPTDEKDIQPLGLFSGRDEKFRNHIAYQLMGCDKVSAEASFSEMASSGPEPWSEGKKNGYKKA